MSIIEEIYLGHYQPQEGKTPIPKDMLDKDLAFWEKVSKEMGDEFVDTYFHRVFQEDTINDLHHFREGFRLGVRMMLEVIAPQ